MHSFRLKRSLEGELSKFLTLKPLSLFCGISLVFVILFSLLDSYGVAKAIRTNSSILAEGVSAETAGLSNFLLFAFIPIVTGVLLASSEYSSGQMITSSLAVPHRSILLATKLLVSAIASLTFGAVMALSTLSTYQVMLGDKSIWESGTVSAYLTRLSIAGLYWLFLGAMSTSIAVLIRSQVVALTLMVMLSFGGISLLLISPEFQYCPTVAGMIMFNPEQALGLPHQPTMTSSEATMVVFCWAAVLIVMSFIAFNKRDVGARQVNIE